MWHLIESAPKDGKNIDLVVEGRRVADARWGIADETWNVQGVPEWIEYTTDYHGYGEWGWYPITGVPTHWMLPPALPVVEARHD